MRCNFEWGLCGWQNLRDDEFDWTRSKGMTDSIGTGPMFDHTTATSAGYYIYTETSYPRQPGDRARLASQPLSGTMNYQYCTLRLYYHMYGDHIGKLSVKIRECKKCKERLIWSRDTSAGNYWVRHFVNIQNDKPFQIILEAQHGTGYAGDIALDDITFYNCRPFDGVFPTASPCKPDEFYCFKDGKCINVEKKCDYRNDCSDGQDEYHCGPCNFEDDVCGYSDVSTGKYEWVRSDPSWDHWQGPPIDGDNNKKGHYYIVLDGDGLSNQFARMQSLPLPATGPNCVVQFSYFANTTSYSWLYIYHQQNSTESLILRKLIAPSGQWRTTKTGIGARPAGWILKFAGWKRAVAVDNIEFQNCALAEKRGGRCSRLQTACDNGACIHPDQVCDFANDCGDNSDEKPSICSNFPEKCDFESGLCDWTRSRGGTTSYDTGPGVDHTKGTRLGYYMYIETSTGSDNDNARLYSTTFQPVTPNDRCAMRFYYHMFGAHVESLVIWQKLSADYQSQEKLLWTMKGDQGDIWKQATVPL